MPKAKLLVTTKPGEKCPCEENPRTYITHNPKGTEVNASAYYRRLVDDGSLSLVLAKTKGGDA